MRSAFELWLAMYTRSAISLSLLLLVYDQDGLHDPGSNIMYITLMLYLYSQKGFDWTKSTEAVSQC
jgi:hypothetical protein